MSGFRRTSWLVPSAESWVRTTLASVNVSGGAIGEAVTSVPYWSHAIVYYFVRAFGLQGYATSISYSERHSPLYLAAELSRRN